MSDTPRRSLLKALGPGFLFAGAAVGVSHLVQSTRAGALFGLGLLGLVILANIIKYPPFSFGPRYAAATGTSLLEGYRRQGRWALVLYLVLTLATMFTVQAAVTLVAAGLLGATFGLKVSPVMLGAILTAGCAAILLVGRFRALDLVIKAVVAVLTVLTVVAALAALPRLNFGTAALIPSGMDTKALLFMAALVGWMPSAIDVSVWHSLWTLARRRDTQHAPSLRESMLDFNIGYLGTAGLAVCFVILGAAVIHGTGNPVAAKPVAFAMQIFALYTTALGDWSYWLIAVSALLVMFSTTLTVIDGFPRALSTLWHRFHSAEEPGSDAPTQDRAYWVAGLVLAVGSIVVIWYAVRKDASSLPRLIDLATTLSFLTAPMLSVLNHRAIMGAEVPTAFRPGPRMVAFSLASISIQAVFAAWYIWVRFLA